MRTPFTIRWAWLLPAILLVHLVLMDASLHLNTAGTTLENPRPVSLLVDFVLTQAGVAAANCQLESVPARTVLFLTGAILLALLFFVVGRSAHPYAPSRYFVGFASPPRFQLFYFRSLRN